MPEKGMDRRGIGGHAIVAHDSRQQAAGLADHRRGSRQAGVTFGVRNHTVHGGAADLEPLSDLRGTEPFVLQPQDLGRVDCRRPPLVHACGLRRGDPFELALAT
jgi:hypothetical protein